jgi:hypothetical protein
MKRLCGALVAGVLAGFVSGCGDEQTGRPAQPNEVTPEFTKNTLDMMKNANTGIPDPKQAKNAARDAAKAAAKP